MKLNIYIFVPAHFTVITIKEKKIYSKLTSAPFHVRKEVIIVLYTADEEKPIAAEGRTFDCRSHRRVEDGRLEAPEI